MKRKRRVRHFLLPLALLIAVLFVVNPAQATSVLVGASGAMSGVFDSTGSIDVADVDGDNQTGVGGHMSPDMGSIPFSYEVTVKGFFSAPTTITGVGDVNNTDTSKLISALNFNPSGLFFTRKRIIDFKITETGSATVSLGDLQSDVYLAEGDEVVAWIKLLPTPTLYASTHAAQGLNHDFSYELKATGTESPDVTFQVALTASGREVVEEQHEEKNDFPYLRLRSGRRPACTEATRTICLPNNCQVDYNRSYTTHTGYGGGFGQAGNGYGIVVNSMRTENSNAGSGYASHRISGNCLTSTVKICRRGLWRAGSWYDADHYLYGTCTQERDWTHTQNKGPFTLNVFDGFTHLTDYTGPIGSGGSNVVQVLPNETTYSVAPFGIGPSAAAPSLGLSMVQDGNSSDNGNELWGTTTYQLPWSDTKQGSGDIIDSEGVKYIDTFTPPAPDDNTVYGVSWIDSPENSGTKYTDRNRNRVVEAGDFKGWMSSLALGSPSYDFFVAFDAEPPTAIIDSISPNPVGVDGTGTSLSVSFDGHGEPGPITGATWRSNRPSPSGTTLETCTGSPCNFSESGLAPGQHLISFQVEALTNTPPPVPLISPAATKILRVNQAPLASITSIDSTGEQPGWPNPTTIAIEWRDDQFQVGHAPVDFVAQAVDTDGTIASYRWESDRDGFLSDDPSFTANDLSIGMHTITFTATDNDGVQSNSVTRRLRVMRPPTLLVHGLCSSAGAWRQDDITEGGTVAYTGTPINVPGRALDPVEVNSDTQVRIYTILGQLVRSATIPAGANHFVWDGTDGGGSAVAAGAYVYELEFDSQVVNLIGAYYPIERISITPSDAPLPVGALQVENRVQTMTGWYGVPEVNVVAHSMGGLNSRWYIQNLGYEDDVNKLVMLGTPNHGSTLAVLERPGASGAHITTLLNPFAAIGALVGLGADIFGSGFCSTDDLIPQSAALQALNGNRKDEGFSGSEPNDNIGTMFGDTVPYFNIWGGNLPSISHLHARPPFPISLLIDEVVIGTVSFKTDWVVHKRSARLDNVPSEKMGWRSHNALTTKADSLQQALSYLGDGSSREALPRTNQGDDVSELLAGHVIYAPEQASTISTGETQQQEFEVDAESNNLDVVLMWPEEEGTSLSLQLLSPSGVVIDENTTLSDVIYDNEGPNMVTYHITDTETGTWTAIVEPVSLSGNSTQYSLLAFGESDFWVGMAENHEQITPGDPFTISVYAQKDGSPTAGLDVEATLVKSLNVGPRIGSKYGNGRQITHAEEIVLTDNGDGSYQAVYNDTAQSGSYRVFVAVTDPNSGVSRTAFTTFFVEDEYEFSIQESDITLSNETPSHNEVIRVHANVHNNSAIDANGVEVWFTDGNLGENGEVIAKKTVDIPAGGTVSTSTLWQATAGQHEIFVIVSPANSYLEKNIDNNIASKTITLTDTPPVADAGSNQTARFDADSQSSVPVFLDGGGSRDDLGVEQYNWDIDTSVDSDGDSIPDNDVDFTGVRPFLSTGAYSAVSEYEVKLTVLDTAGQSSSDTLTITVQEGYDVEPPTADAGPDQVALVGTAVDFDGSGSADDYGIAIYSWDLDIDVDSNGDGVKDNDVDLVGKQPVLAAGYAQIGTYTVKLTVSDVAGNDTASDTMDVVVREGRDDCSVTIGLPAQTSPCVSAPDNIVAWWSLDEASGSSAADLVGSNDGTHVNAPTPTAGKVAGALSFDGVNDYVEVPDDDALDFDLSDFSLNAWVKTENASGVKTILDKRYEDRRSSTQGYSLYLRAGEVGFQLADGGDGSWICSPNPGSSCTNYLSGVSIADGEWHLIGVSVDRDDPTGGKFYVDGEEVATFDPTIRDGSLSNDRPLRLGSHSSFQTGFFNGALDDATLFNRALTSAEIRAIFHAGSAGMCHSAQFALQEAVDMALPGEIVCMMPASYSDSLQLSTNDLTLDCQGATLKQTGEVPSTVGINVLGSSGADVSGVSVENCQAEGFEVGFAAGFGRSGNQQVSDVQFLQNTATKNQTGFYSDAVQSRFTNNSASENTVGMKEDGTNNRYRSNKIDENEDIGLHITSGVGGVNVNRNQVCSNGNLDIARDTATPAARNKAMEAIGLNRTTLFIQSNTCDSVLNWNDPGARGCRTGCSRIITPYDTLPDAISANTHFDKGTYLLPEGLEITDSDVTITCNQATIRGNGINSAIKAQGVSNLVINGCRFENYDNALSFSNLQTVELTNVEVVAQNRGLELLNTSAVTLTASTIEGAKSAVFIDERSTSVTLSQNHLTSAGNSNATLIIEGDGSQVRENTISNGIQIAGDRNQVVANTIQGKDVFSAIRIENGQQNTIAENQISDAQRTGIVLNDATNNQIRQNTIDQVSQDIFLDNAAGNQIVENTLSATEEGIVAINSTGNQLLSNNASRKFGSGIELINSNGFTLQGNTLNSNNVGILLIESDQNSISENTASGNAQAALQAVDSSDNDIQNNDLSGNPSDVVIIEELVGNTEDDLDFQKPGVQVLSRTTLTHSGSVPNPNAQNLSWEWRYTVDGGDEVSISSGTYPQEPVEDVTFTYPAESAGATYSWILRTDEGQGVVIDRILTIEVMPTIEAAPTSLSATPGVGETASQTLTIRNRGSSQLTFSVDSNATWLTATPTSGAIAPNDSVPITVKVDATNLTTGIYNGLLTIDSDGTNEPPVEVPLLLKVGLSDIEITEVTPHYGMDDVSSAIYIYGTGFSDSPTVTLGPTQTLDVDFVMLNEDPQRIRAVVPRGVTPGVYDITVETTSGRATLADAYEVLDAGTTDDLLSSTDWMWTEPKPMRVGFTNSRVGLLVQHLGGTATLDSVTVEFRLDSPTGEVLGRSLTNLLAPDAIELTGPVTWEPAEPSDPEDNPIDYTVCAIIDPDNEVEETNENNNQTCQTVTVYPPHCLPTDDECNKDTEPPEVDSFAIADDAQTTNQQAVTLDVAGTDYPLPPDTRHSGMGKVKPIEFEYFHGARRWAPVRVGDWVDYDTAQSDYPWDLIPSYGMRYMQAWAADNAENISLKPGVDVIDLLPTEQADRVGRNGVKFYRIFLKEGQRFAATMTPESRDPDMYVWLPDSSLRHNVNSTGPETVEFEAPFDGTYQIEIHNPNSGRASYRLEFGATRMGPIDDPTAHSRSNKAIPEEPAVPLDEWPEFYDVGTPPPPTTTNPDEPLKLYLPLVIR